MEEKTPESSEDAEHRMICEALAPGKVANFPGSLVANQLGQTAKASSYPQDKGKLANWVAYFREGCDDPSIWKSAVSIRPEKKHRRC